MSTNIPRGLLRVFKAISAEPVPAIIKNVFVL
jgi:hypothetical protein